MSTMVPMSSVKLTQGRSGVSGITATIFGASGFLGKYVVNRFGKMGTRCMVPYRGDEVDVRHLKLCGDLGVVNMFESSIRSLDDIETAVAGSNVVINLLGKHFETSRWKFHDVHATFPSVLAQVCADVGTVERLVHVSALGAFVDAPSAFSRSKALGEELVRDAFPGATILRPATMYGDEDKFLNRIAKLSQTLPFYPLIDAATTRQQPVYMDDVAHAIVKCATSSQYMGQTYDLAGPNVYTNKEIVDYVFETIKEESNALNLPRSVGYPFAFAFQQLPGAWLNLDGFKRQSVDLLQAEGSMGFAELGMDDLTPMEEVAERYLVRFRKASMFIDDTEEVVKQPN